MEQVVVTAPVTEAYVAGGYDWNRHHNVYGVDEPTDHPVRSIVVAHAFIH